MSAQKAWLAEFLLMRGLTRPSCKMLYAYRLTGEEYESLRQSIKASLAGASFEELAKRSRSFCAQFVLFAAEWWHREYRQGAWRWTPIFESLGYRKTVDANRRTEAVERGFAYWGHRPFGAGKKFFGAIVAHGGLPLRALSEGAGRLTGLLLNALRLAGRYGWQEEQIVDALRERAVDLPDSLKNEDIYLLLAKIVLTALELRRECSLTATSDVLATLQRHDPAWMERFPISLEEASAKPLLTDLVKEAAATQFLAGRGSAFSIERGLISTGDGQFGLQTKLRAKRSLNAEQLVQCFGLKDVSSLPGFFSIDVSLPRTESWLNGRLLLGQEGVVRFNGQDLVLPDEQGLGEIALTLRHRMNVISDGPVAVPGGGALDFEQPWVFAERDGSWRLITQGGARLPDTTLRVVVDSSFDACGDDAVSKPALIGRMSVGGAPDDPELHVYEVSGSAIFALGSQIFRIRCGQSTRLSETLTWEGKRFAWQPLRYPAFRGKPDLYRVSEDGARTRVSAGELIWKQAGSGRAIRPDELQGVVDAFLVQDGETMARFRLLILDKDARVDFESGDRYGRGTVRLRCLGAPNVAVLDGPEQCRITKTPQSCDLEFAANGAPPEVVKVVVSWVGPEVTFVFPFPATGGRFHDSDGREIKDGASLVPSDLPGTRLRIFDTNPQAARRYTLELELLCTDRPRGRGLVEELPLALPTSGVAEIRLIDYLSNIETLLSFSANLDAVVRLSLKVGGKTSHSISVARYAVGLERGGGNLLCIPSAELGRLSATALEALKLRAAPLLVSDGAPVELCQTVTEGVPAGVWCLDGLDTSKGHWLIFPDVDNAGSVRPTLWVSDSCQDFAPEGALGAAMALPVREERLAAIEQVLGDMSEQYDHASWSFLDYLCQAFSHLPLGALDVFHVIAAQPQYAVALAIRSSHHQIGSLCRRLGSEAGFIWELTSPSDWVEALSRLRALYVLQLGGAAENVFPLLRDDRVRRLQEALPSIGFSLELACYRDGGCPSDSIREMLSDRRRFADTAFQSLLRGDQSALQTILLRNHADDPHWPESRFLPRALEALGDLVPSASEALIESLLRRLVWAPGPQDFKLSVANMPAVCAVWAASGLPRDWWRDPERRFSLRRIRAFDPEWLREAYQLSLAVCVANGLCGLFPVTPASRSHAERRAIPGYTS